MKTNKKILSLFLALFLAVGALISPTFAMNVQAAELPLLIVLQPVHSLQK